MLHLSCYICVKDSINCKPFLPSQFFIIANCSVCGMSYNLKILFTSSLKFLCLLYLSSASQLKVGCFILGLPSLGPTFCVLSVLVTAIACIAVHVASAIPCANASLAFVCSLAIM